MLLFEYQIKENNFKAISEVTRQELMLELTNGTFAIDTSGEKACENITDKLPEVSPCWLWQGPFDKRGYGRIKVPVANVQRSEESARRSTIWMSTHRLAYLLRHGSIPSGYRIIHSCGEASCCNPNHLIAVPWRR